MKGDRIDYKITDHDIPIRLDRYLRLLNPKLTQGVIEKSLREKRITVNKQKAKSNSRITNGDIVSIDSSLQDIYCEEKIDEVIQNDNGSLAPKARPRSRDDKVAIAPRKLADKLLKEYLLYDHPKFYAFNKPAGLASQGGSKISLALDDAFKVLGLRLVHRLDKETSGIILAAKTRDSAIILTGAFAKHKIYKTYLAIVSPSLKKKKGRIVSDLSKFSSDKPKSLSHGEEKESITDYEVLSSDGKMDLVKFMPLTGRMHQIRLHSLELGSPIVGDKKYGNIANTNLMLHAHKIKLDKSIFGEEIIITSNMPDYFSMFYPNISVQS